MSDHETLVDLVCCECQQPFKAEQHHRVCPPCVEQYMADHTYDDDEGDETTDDLEDDCGLMHGGQCSQAGTEHCDFECPNRESELFCGSAAWRQKHGED